MREGPGEGVREGGKCSQVYLSLLLFPLTCPHSHQYSCLHDGRGGKKE